MMRYEQLASLVAALKEGKQIYWYETQMFFMEWIGINIMCGTKLLHEDGSEMSSDEVFSISSTRSGCCPKWHSSFELYLSHIPFKVKLNCTIVMGNVGENFEKMSRSMSLSSLELLKRMLDPYIQHIRESGHKDIAGILERILITGKWGPLPKPL